MNKKRVLLLVDGDMVAFSHCAAEEYGKEPEDVSFAKIQMSMDSKMEFMKRRLGATDTICLVSGDENMRHVIFPGYKANRDGVWKPDNLKNAKAHLMVAWNGIRMNYLEADDFTAIFARHKYDIVMGKRNTVKRLNRIGPCDYDEIIIASLDKDLRQVGRQGDNGPVIKHYQWERPSQNIGEKLVTVSGLGELKCTIKETKSGKKKEIKGTGPLFFLWQMLTGDTTDGIIGCGVMEEKVYKSGKKAGESYTRRDGIGAVEAFEIVDGSPSYYEGLQRVLTQYVIRFGERWQEEALKNGRLLYMHHHVDDGRYIRLWHYDGKTVDRFDLVEGRVISQAEYLQIKSEQ